MSAHTLAHTRTLSGCLKWIATIDFQVISTFQVDAHKAAALPPCPSGTQYWSHCAGFLADGACCPNANFRRWQHLSGSALNFTEIAINENTEKQIVSITEYCRIAPYASSYWATTNSSSLMCLMVSCGVYVIFVLYHQVTVVTDCTKCRFICCQK